MIGRGVLHAPAVRALAIQCAAFVLMVLSVLAADALLQLQISNFIAAFIQGGFAAALSHWRRLAPWWLLIQFLFPVAAVAVQLLHLPPLIFFAAFALLVGVYWSTFRTQVPFYPSGPSARRAVAEVLPQQSIRFIDIGSGLGELVLHLAWHRPDSHFSGIELAPLPWLASVLRARFNRNPSRFIHGDYGKLNFAEYDVVFAYLSPAAMPALWEKARAEMRAGSLLLSYEFPIPGQSSEIVSVPDDDGRCLYGWHM